VTAKTTWEQNSVSLVASSIFWKTVTIATGFVKLPDLTHHLLT